jgi:uncharacterized protein (TIGR03000 family)
MKTHLLVWAGLLACTVLLADAAPVLAQRFRPFGRFRPALVNRRPYPWPYPPYPWGYPPDPYPVYFGSPIPVNYQSPAGSIDPISYSSSTGYTPLTGYNPYAPALPPPQENTAVIGVTLPTPTANVWFDGHKTASGGWTRTFHTTPLEPGKSYRYTVRAEWDEGGQRRNAERTVEVTAGQVSRVDFSKEAGKKQ